jgi:predicted transcriptional regulator
MSSVGDYMNTGMVIRDSKATVMEVAKTMTQWNISSVAITDDRGTKVIGILTERDIVKSIARGVTSGRTTAGSLMSTPVVSVKSDMPIEQAARLMIREKVRHLLVEDAYHRVTGIITTTDLARYLKQRMSTTKGTPASAADSSDPLLSEVWELFF